MADSGCTEDADPDRFASFCNSVVLTYFWLRRWFITQTSPVQIQPLQSATTRGSRMSARPSCRNECKLAEMQPTLILRCDCGLGGIRTGPWGIRTGP